MTTTFNTYQLPKVWPITLHRPADGIRPHLHFNTQTFVSPFTRNTQTAQWPGALWNAEAAFPPIDGQRGAVAKQLHAFITSLRGGGGRFVFPAYTCRYAPPEPLQPERVTLIPFTADTANVRADSTRYTADRTRWQYETVFNVTSCPDVLTIEGVLLLNSGKAPLEVGSFISWDEAAAGTFVDRHMHQVIAMSYTPTTGAAVLTVEPAMTHLPTPATPMHVHAPSAVYRMVDDAQAVLRKAGSQVSFGFTAVQSRPIKLVV